VSAALKQKPALTPTPFPRPERAALAHAIARAADADVRKAALVKACATADEEVRLARRALDAAGEAVEAAPSNAAKHLTDVARGTAGEPPLTIRQARAVAIEAADHLEACLAARDALNAERVDGSTGLSALLVTDAARAVVRAEMADRGAALAADISQLQRELVARGSALEWLANAGVFPQKNGRPADDAIRHTVFRMEQTSQWTMSEQPGAAPFARPGGRLAWQAAFELLLADASTPLPPL
jgi:hypothetical protein